MAKATEVEEEKTPMWIKVSDFVDDGKLDDGLDEIMRAIVSRREIVSRRRARRMVGDLKQMDRVVLTNGVKPKYLEGMPGVIAKIEGMSALVNLAGDLPSRRGRPSKDAPATKVWVSIVHLRKLAEGEQAVFELNEDEYIGDDQEEDDDE